MSDLLVAAPTTEFDFAGTMSRTDALGGFNICAMGAKPDRYEVLREAFASQGLIRRMVDEPAKAASRIEIFPQYEQNGALTRAIAENSQVERLAWTVFRQLSEQGGNQRRLVQEMHKILFGYGHGWGLTLNDIATGRRYLKFVPFHTVKATRHRGRDLYEWREFENKPVVYLEQADVQYLKVPDDLGFTGDAFSVFAPMVDTIITWTIVWSALSSAARSSMFSAGLLWARVPEGEKSWVDKWLPVITEVSKQINANPSTLTRMIPHPVSSAEKPEHVDFGESIQDNLMKFEAITREMLAAMLTTAPMKQIIEGEGAGSQWASTLLLREILNGYGRPQLEDVVNPVLMQWKFHAALKAIFDRYNISMDVQRWSIGTNILKAAIRPEDPAGALNAFKGMGTSREWVIQQYGGTKADLLELPDGVDEFEFWRLANAAGRNNAGAFDPNTDPNGATDPNRTTGMDNPPSDTENNFSPNERGPNQAEVDRWARPMWRAA